jgi:hypothetical protein
VRKIDKVAPERCAHDGKAHRQSHINLRQTKKASEGTAFQNYTWQRRDKPQQALSTAEKHD